MVTARRYRCIHCGKFEPWGAGWVWYGSWLQFEKSGAAEIYCSEECATRHSPRPFEVIDEPKR